MIEQATEPHDGEVLDLTTEIFWLEVVAFQPLPFRVFQVLLQAVDEQLPSTDTPFPDKPKYLLAFLAYISGMRKSSPFSEAVTKDILQQAWIGEHQNEAINLQHIPLAELDISVLIGGIVNINLSSS